jgi:hypothetical protein
MERNAADRTIRSNPSSNSQPQTPTTEGASRQTLQKASTSKNSSKHNTPTKTPDSKLIYKIVTPDLAECYRQM